MSEQTEAQKKPEPKHSITERLKYEQEQQKQTQEQKTPNRKNRIWNSNRHLPFSL